GAHRRRGVGQPGRSAGVARSFFRAEGRAECQRGAGWAQVRVPQHGAAGGWECVGGVLVFGGVHSQYLLGAVESFSMSADSPADLGDRYFLDLAAAFVRGKLPSAPDLAPAELVQYGLQAGLRLHKFKRTSGLPRVRKVLGILRGLAP